MSVLRKRIAPAAAAALLFLALPACSTSNESTKESGRQAAVSSKDSGAPNDVIEKVNGKAITKGDLDRGVKALLSQKQAPQPVTDAVMLKARETALSQLVAAELLYQAAASVEIGDLDRKVRQKVAETRASHKNDEDFQKALKGMGLTLASFEELARRDIVISSFIEGRFASRATASEAEARQFYDANREKFKMGEMVRASHILIGVRDGAGAVERAKAKEKAESILKRVREGEDFGVLASTCSDCPSKVRRGDLGAFGRGKMDQAFEKTAFALKRGKISDVVETQFGYHIIKVTEKREARMEPYETVRERILTYLKKEKTLKLLAEFVSELRSKAKIEKV